MTLFGNGVCRRKQKVRGGYTGLGWTLNLTVDTLIKKRKGRADKNKENGHGEREADTGAMQLQAKGCMEPSEARKRSGEVLP